VRLYLITQEYVNYFLTLMLNAGFWLESDDNQDEEPEQQEEEDADPQEANDNLMRLLQQLRGVPNGEEGEERDDAGMDDVLNRLMAHLNPGRGAQEPPSPQMILNEQMYQAARSGDLQALQQAVSSGADLRYQHDCEKPNQQNLQRKIKTALHVASSKGHPQIVKWILEKCPDAVRDESPDLSRNALHYACNKKAGVEVLQLLLDVGQMDVNAESRNGWLPIHYTVASARLDLSKYLLTKGARLHAEFETGGNALTIASCSKNEELVKWLLDNGVSPNVQDKQGLTALHRLSRFGDLSMTKLLVEYGHADVQLLDNSGCSVMEEADRNNMSEIATYLWTKGCESTSVKNPDGMGPTAWFRVRHIKLPSARYGCGLAHIGSKLVLFSGLGQDIDYVNHDNENHLPADTMTSALKDTYTADLNAVTHSSLVPIGVNPARPDLSLSSHKCGRFIRLDADGLGGWSIPCPSTERLHASIVIATRPFKREEKFGYFEVHVVDGGENRIVTVGLVDENYPVNEKQPGWDKDSYGYHGDDGGCFHNNGAGKAWGERFNPGDVIGCGINFEGSGEVFWTKNGKFLGVSHIGPQADAYYATVGVENDGAIFKVNFGRTPFQFSFVVPTLTWQRAPPQEEFACAVGRLIALPEVNEVLAIPDRLTALSKVWLFSMRTNKWRTHSCVGARPVVLSRSQFVRLGDAIYVWNTAGANKDDPSSMNSRSPALFRLDLDYWSWSELLSYNVMADALIDDNLQPIDEDDSSEEESDDSSDEEDGFKKEVNVAAGANFLAQADQHADQRLASKLNSDAKGTRARERALKRSAALKKSSQLLSTEGSANTDEFAIAIDQSADGIGSSDAASVRSGASGAASSESEHEKPKLTPKEAMAARMHHVVSLLDSEFKDAFVVAMEQDLVFVAHMRMLKVNPKNFAYSLSDLRGTRPRITHHSAVAVGTDIVTFGGWDDRKQQNELFILDTRSKLWYKPHISGLLFPRPRNNHSCVYFETKNPIFAMDPSDDAESSILAKHASSQSFTSDSSTTSDTSVASISAATSASSPQPTGQAVTVGSNQSNVQADGVYRFCVIAMGWNGANTMIDLDFVALDTQKRVEELGNMLDQGDASLVVSSASAGVDFDIKIDVASPDSDGAGVKPSGVTVGAHKAILWARSDYFKALLTEELMAEGKGADSETKSELKASTGSTGRITMEGTEEHVRALLRFLYTDHVNVVPLLADYRGFIRVAEKYAPNHVQRLVAEYLHTKVYEPEKLNEELGDLLESGAFADVTFSVAGTTFKAHKVVLAARSSFFRALLTGGLKESRQATIELDDCTTEEFGALLKFLYSRSVDYAHISDYILGLFALADRCDARRLKAILESLIAFNLDSSNVASLLILADQLAALSLKRSCIDFIRRDPSAVIYEDPTQQAQVTALLKL
jgi:ankyrin repeat protein